MHIKIKGETMVNWYYVIGSDRVGPVSVEALKELFLSDKINLDSYVWKKGFQNWERLRDVSELKFEKAPVAPVVEEVKVQPALHVVKEEVQPQVQAEIKTEIKVEPSSPEINFSFDWHKVKDQEDLFFLKVGKDRKSNLDSTIYGPYSMVELKEALKEKRINLQTLIFAPGMSSWTKIEETMLNEKFKGSTNSISLNEVPLLLVVEHSPTPLVTLLKKTSAKEGILLGSGPFSQLENKTVQATLYMGSEVKAKNLKLQVQNYNKKDQSMECHFVDLNSDAKKIMLNHAI
jgi:hypothetical protein